MRGSEPRAVVSELVAGSKSGFKTLQSFRETLSQLRIEVPNLFGKRRMRDSSGKRKVKSQREGTQCSGKEYRSCV